MQNIMELLIEKYGYNEPIFTQELKQESGLKPTSFWQMMQQLTESGSLIKVKNGIYFIPKSNSFIGRPVLSVEKIVRKKYLLEHGEVIGYKTGINFANQLRLTSQTASVYIVASNNTSARERQATFYNARVIVKRPRTLVTTRNHKLLQALDLLHEFDRYSEISLLEAKKNILKYLRDVVLSEAELIHCTRAYPQKTSDTLVESGIYEELVRQFSHG